MESGIEALTDGDGQIRLVKIDLLTDDEAVAELGVEDALEAKNLFRKNLFVVLSVHHKQFEEVVMPALLNAGIEKVFTSRVGPFLHFSCLSPTGEEEDQAKAYEELALCMATTLNAIKEAGEKCYILPPTIHAEGDGVVMESEDGSHTTRLLLDRDHSLKYRVLEVTASPDGKAVKALIRHHYQVVDDGGKTQPDPNQKVGVQKVGDYHYRDSDTQEVWMDFMVNQIMKKASIQIWTRWQEDGVAYAIRKALYQATEASTEAVEKDRQFSTGFSLASAFKAEANRLKQAN